MSGVRTRLATADDVPLIAPLFDAYRQFYGQPADRPLAGDFLRQRLQQRESVVLLATDAFGAGLGFCQLYPTFCSVEAAPTFTLYDLFVDASARRRGVGRALLVAAERFAMDRKRVRLDLTTARTNLSAQALYESLGWVRDAVVLTYQRRVPAG